MSDERDPERPRPDYYKIQRLERELGVGPPPPKMHRVRREIEGPTGETAVLLSWEEVES